jgi:prefoldin subunit 5
VRCGISGAKRQIVKILLRPTAGAILFVDGIFNRLERKMLCEIGQNIAAARSRKKI